MFTVDRQQTVAGAAAALTASTAAGFDRRHVVVSEHPIPGLLPVTGGSTGASIPAGSARLVSYRAQRIVADATVSHRSMLVLTDIHYPGWQVSVDGRPAPIDRVDYVLRGVLLSSGTHRIVFTYAPASFRAGWIISLVTLLGLLVTLIIGLRRHALRRGRSRDRPVLAGAVAGRVV